MVWGYFDTDGANDPSVCSPNIASVTRFSNATDAIYRVRFIAADFGPLDFKPTWVHAGSVLQLTTDRLSDPVQVLDFVPTSGTPLQNRPREDRKEIDLRITNLAGVSVNNIGAGRRVGFSICIQLENP
jgi:hypothetical protein